MDILEAFRADVRSKRGRLGQIAAETGIKPKTLRNILYGESKNPRYRTVEQLRAFYATDGDAPSASSSDESASGRA